MLKELIRADLYRYGGKSTLAEYVKAKCIYPSFRYTVIYRKCYYYGENKKKIRYLYYRYRLLHLSKKTGYQIGYGAKIGKGFYIGHRGNLVINREATIGDNVNIAVGVTIGQENRGKRKGVPTIGSNVWIGTNSVIVGKITVGNNVLIAPNSYVNFDIPSNAIVIGNPAKIIENRFDATKDYLQCMVK